MIHNVSQCEFKRFSRGHLNHRRTNQMRDSRLHLQCSADYLRLAKFSFGVGDRFVKEAKAQLKACMLAGESGVEIVPVWNKSNREHSIVGSLPLATRAAADAAVRELGWTKPYHVDADHITLANVDKFLAASDYYTLDVADAIAKPAAENDVYAFLNRHPELIGTSELPGVAVPITLSKSNVAEIARKYLVAAREAGQIYRRIVAAKGAGCFITEVSMDETDAPQTPAELLVILAALADEQVPVQAIAPKFTGRFNKGVDYVGDAAQFEAEFRGDIAVIAHAVIAYGLPKELKLSVHSGSDKFSIYPAIRRAIQDFNAGVHVKTAGTTWLEEVIGLAEGGSDGLALAKEIYAQAFEHREDLCAPYATVIDIDLAKLPAPAHVRAWTAEQYANALRHNQQCPEYNPSFRQLIHVGYKVAAKFGDRYLDMLDACAETISRNVTTNLFERHLKPLFLPEAKSTTAR
ncbi:MAG TPA: tagaturonate epimerase family protein [Clostridia bacterium]|nr:tagaturonate epimerase family protein [Clostridia bacterium]